MADRADVFEYSINKRRANQFRQPINIFLKKNQFRIDNIYGFPSTLFSAAAQASVTARALQT
jgi:hypothetical protein